ncbi:hypothetical protein I5F06_18785, partial [Proteus mirabilis]|nr:hypothetical protein [Proteus mirabilis]
MRDLFFQLLRFFKKPGMIVLLLLIFVIGVLFTLYYSPDILGEYFLQKKIWLKNTLVTGVVLFFSITLLFIIAQYMGKFNYINVRGKNKSIKSHIQIDHTNTSFINDIIEYSKNYYGTFWRKKITIQLLIGTPTSIEKLTPNLTADIWQESN